jgi:hypothetical protein
MLRDRSVRSIWWDIVTVRYHLEALVLEYCMVLCFESVLITDMILIKLAQIGSKGRF